MKGLPFISPTTRSEEKTGNVADEAIHRSMRHGPFVTYLQRFGLCSRDRCIGCDKGNTDRYATDCPVTKPFHFMNPSSENLSTWCENIVQNERSLARLMNIMKVLHGRRHDIIID
ncbi:hypothetical protein AVEN_178806-1 [Araneus ventricosus]|uniref:Uncharacterized protein n=1 Tax=Araneus ventricosus TaxID=182803 RepID=A0A4Y2BFN9_ARAVE|nr:hypothetical protein AVEN_178806-1 [Araneus ventricosus]